MYTHTHKQVILNNDILNAYEMHVTFKMVNETNLSLHVFLNSYTEEQITHHSINLVNFKAKILDLTILID